MKKKIGILIVILLIIICAIIFLVKNKNSKYNYDLSKINSYEYFTLVSNEKCGVINKNGDIIIEPNYTKIAIPNPEKDIFFCYDNDDVQVLNSKKEKLYDNFEKVEPINLKNVATTLNYEKDTFTFFKDGKYGLINIDGKIIAKNEYDSIENLQLCEGTFLVKQNSKYGIINKKGTIVIKPEYDNIASDEYYTETDGYKKAGYIVSNKTEDGYRYGYVTLKGKKYLDAEFNSIDRVSQNTKNSEIYLVVSQNGKYGLYKNKKKIIETEYQSMKYDDNSELIILQKGSKYGMASLDGKIVINVENTNIESKGIYIYASKENENKVFDKSGNTVNINFNKSIYETENENYRISTLDNNDKTYYGITDKNGNNLVSEKYKYIEYIFVNYFIAENDEGKYGIITSNGKEAIEFKYSLLQKIKGKKILQAINSETKATDFYNSSLKIILSAKDAQIDNKEGYIKVTSNGNIYYFDEDGNKLDENSEIITKKDLLAEPEKIGIYKKVQFTLENVYYVKE